MSTLYTTFLSKSDFSFALLLVTFEPLEVEQSYIPVLKALKCVINAVGAQGRGCSSSLCHAHLKIGVLLHKEATVQFDLILAVYFLLYFSNDLNEHLHLEHNLMKEHLCSQCDKPFSSKPMLTIHLMETHEFNPIGKQNF